jgi:hypothetical protein
MTELARQNAGPAEAAAVREPYRRPLLEVYGDVRALTLNGTGKNRRDNIFVATRT